MREEHYQQDARLAQDHWWWSARRAILDKVLRRYMPENPSRRILEVGCSTGSNFGMLSKLGALSALEVDETAAEICHQRYPEIELFRQPIPMPLDRSFDAICAFDVIEHIENELRTIDWMHDHLQQGGWLFVTVPAFSFLWSQYDEDAHHFRRYTARSLKNSLTGKFEIKYLTYFNTHLFPIIAITRMLQRIGVLDFGGRDKELGSRGAINAALRTIFAAERLWIPKARLPFGVSLLAVAQKQCVKRI